MNGMPDAFAAYAKDKKLRLVSSSGGVFSLLAKVVFYASGAVYGVAMSQDCKSAEFIRLESQDSLWKLQGSKYLQAQVGDTYRKVKADLDAGKKVLFSGTGCQVNGLKCFLGKDYENLYCIDVLCHGTPSPKLWREYVQYAENKEGGRLLSVSFRSKDDSWSDFGIKRVHERKRAVYTSMNQDPYLLMFLRDYSLRPSCYHCVIKKHKLSDLTLADFWGIDHLLPEMNDERGVSLVVVRTEKGMRLFNSIAQELMIQRVKYEDGVRRNPADYSSAKRPEERELFFRDMNSTGFEALARKYAVPVSVTPDYKVKQAVVKTLRKMRIQKHLYKRKTK